MKTQSKSIVSFFAMLLMAGALSACGGDKPAETAKPEPAKSQTTAQTPKAEEPKAQEPQSQTPKAEEPKNDTAPQADAPADKANAETSKAETPKDEAKKETPTADSAKTEVKALSLEEGKKRYEKTCKACHDQGLLDAPKLSDKAGWAKRLEKGVDTLHTHSAKGFNKMPAQATGEVSEAEVYAAVDYMIAQVK